MWLTLIFALVIDLMIQIQRVSEWGGSTGFLKKIIMIMIIQDTLSQMKMIMIIQDTDGNFG